MSGNFENLDIGGDRIGPLPEAGLYRIETPVTRYPRQEDGPPPGPWLKLLPEGIQIVTPPGDLDTCGNTVHPISKERARQMIHTLEWMIDTTITVVDRHED